VIARMCRIEAIVALVLLAGLLAGAASGGAAAFSSVLQTTASTPGPCSTPVGTPAASHSASGSPVTTPSASGSPVASPEPPCTPVAASNVPAECVVSADGVILPIASNPLKNSATAAGLAITQVLVENNVDPATGSDAPDHLEIALRNDSGAELGGFLVYYEITDLTTGAKEGYCSALTGFTIPAGGDRVVHFDNTGAADHFPDNDFSLYHQSLNEMQVDVTVSAANVAPQTASVTKDAGGAENPDE
jgi:hypothetical protein